MTNTATAVARLRQDLGRVSPSSFNGDNLSIFLASNFETGDEKEETDDSGTWEQQAIDKANAAMDAIHAHYTPLITALAASNAEKDAEIERVIEDAASYCWQRYKGRPPMNLDYPAVFTSHEHQKIRESIEYARRARSAKEGGR